MTYLSIGKCWLPVEQDRVARPFVMCDILSSFSWHAGKAG
jgi:hypothetical protein